MGNQNPYKMGKHRTNITFICNHWLFHVNILFIKFHSIKQFKAFADEKIIYILIKVNNKITELRTILQRESQNS